MPSGLSHRGHLIFTVHKGTGGSGPQALKALGGGTASKVPAKVIILILLYSYINRNKNTSK